MLQRLLIRGPFRGMSGYDRHTRMFTRELAKLVPAVQLMDVRDWGAPPLPTHLLDPWFERLSTPVHAPVTLHFTMPHQVVRVGTAADVNYTMFEADGVPPFWIEHNLGHRLVIVPTESSRQAWLASGYPGERIRVCPLGIDVKLFSGPAKALDIRTASGRPVSEFGTRFLNVSELGPRKNLDGLLEAWLLATTSTDDAVLIVKLSRYRSAMFEIVRRRIEAIERRVGRRIEDAAPVEVLFGMFDDHQMPGLYAAATHYMSMSHGEGWDQPMVEAAVSGLQLIAPDHSAYQAYLTPETATLLPSRLVPVEVEESWVQHLFAGLNWWNPDRDAAVAAIRTTIDGQDVRRTGAGEYLAANYSWQQSAQKLAETLSEVTSGLPG